jgi:hypothetical protein
MAGAGKIRVRRAIVFRIAMPILVMFALATLLIAGEQVVYDQAAPYTYTAAHGALEEYGPQLIKIPGVLLVYVSNDGATVVRVRKIVPEIGRQVPQELNHVRVRLVGVEDVTRRHRHELEMIAGADHVIGVGVESFPDGQLAIVVRVSQPRFEQPLKVPTNIEGIPLRVLVAQDPLTE